LVTHRTQAATVALVALLTGGCAVASSTPGTSTTTSPPPTSTSDAPIGEPPGSTTTPPDTTLVTTPTATTTTGAPAPALAGFTIVVDPGHNGQNYAHLDEINRLVDIGNGTKPCNTTGTAAADGLTEAELNWDVAVRTRVALEALGADVVMTRSDNDGWGPCITERAAIGNEAGADAVVSIHADGGPEGGRGFHVIHPAAVPGLTDDIAAPSLRLAVAVRAAMLETDMPIADYIAVEGLSERSDLGGLNLSDVPAVFLEMGNMKNPVDASLLSGGAFRDAVASAIAAAVEAFLVG
jgi:N-acetylmuramoyl-L-alanine amidase